MTTDERADDAGEQDPPAEDAVEEHDADDETDGKDAPNWWHRDHPVFTPLMGFFTGLVTVVLVPGLYAALLSQLFDSHTAEDLFPYVAVLLVIPLVLMAAERSRRFGRYMLLGMLLTAVVVVAVAALTLWILVRLDG
jgi:hypothetical protein